jgi:hypothetical protein
MTVPSSAQSPVSKPIWPARQQKYPAPISLVVTFQRLQELFAQNGIAWSGASQADPGKMLFSSPKFHRLEEAVMGKRK